MATFLLWVGKMMFLSIAVTITGASKSAMRIAHIITEEPITGVTATAVFIPAAVHIPSVVQTRLAPAVFGFHRVPVRCPLAPVRWLLVLVRWSLALAPYLISAEETASAVTGQW